jgi:hypothetical protein
MYADDQPRIAAYALASPQGLYDTGCFVLATINQHFEYVPGVLRTMREEGKTSKRLSPNTRRGMEALASEAQGLYDDMTSWHRERRTDPHGIAEHTILRYVQLPGFGIVKAGFMAQLGLGVGGCLDRHNLRQAGLKESAFERIPASAEGLHAKVTTYIQTCKAMGGSEVLWDRWCTHVSVLRPHVFPDAEAVSTFHVTCICEQEER